MTEGRRGKTVPESVTPRERPVPDCITIVGGGIGGLAMANALQRVGIDFRLYEQAPELTEVGAGIGLSKNALNVLDILDVGDEVRGRGSSIRKVRLADKKLNLRRELPASDDAVCIHRAVLVDILKRMLPQESIRLSRRVSGIICDGDHERISFSDGSSVSSGCIIAADGIHSVLRRELFPGIRIRYINQTIWRGITDVDVPDLLRDSYVEIWDERLRFLTAPMEGDRTLWLAVKRAPPGEQDDPATVKDELLALFRNFHPVLKDLIRSTETFLRDDMADLGTHGRRWYRGRVVFLGDAIHATTPNLAQGGCQAIEDALCLALCLKKHSDDLTNAFATYQRLREKKAMQIVRTSWNFGKAAHTRNPLIHYTFRAILERSAESFMRKQESFLTDISYMREVGSGEIAMRHRQSLNIST